MPRLGDDLRCVTFRDAEGVPTSAFVPAEPVGSGTPFFLVPALGLDGRSFAPLAPLADERPVVFWNPPNSLPRSSGLEAIAAATLAHARSAGMPERFVLGGSSLGAMIALAAAIAAPSRVAGLVLFGGAAAWNELGAPMRIARWFHPLIPRRGYHKNLATILLARRAAKPGVDPLSEALRGQMEHRTKGYVASVIAATTGAGPFDLRPRLGEIRAPTLVVHARRDLVAPFRAAKTLATIPGSRLVAIDGGSHLPYIHETETCLAELRTFLARIDAIEGA